ncbi:unnamed protein product, partial [Didymodactylos carnosus]
MPRKKACYASLKVNKQRRRRYRQQTTAEEALDNSDETCTDIDEEEEQINTDTQQNSFQIKPVTSVKDYVEDEHDNLTHSDDLDLHTDESRPLYQGSAITIKAANKMLTEYYIDANINKQNVLRLLKIIKSLLPQPNSLPTTWKSILKVFGKSCTSTTTFLCSNCEQQCIKTKYGIKR